MSVSPRTRSPAQPADRSTTCGARRPAARAGGDASSNGQRTSARGPASAGRPRAPPASSPSSSPRTSSTPVRERSSMPAGACASARSSGERQTASAAARSGLRKSRWLTSAAAPPSGSKNGRSRTRAFSTEPSTLIVELGVLLGEVGRHPGHADRLAEVVAPARARHAAAGAAVDDDLAALERHDAVLHLEADELLAEAALEHVLERPLADEVVLVELGDPGHRRLEHVRLRVGVLADEDVHLLEAQDPLRLEAERPDAEVGAALEDRVPDVLAVRAREVDLVAELADEADAQEERRDAGDVRVLGVEVREGLVRDVEVGEPRISSRAFGPATLTAASAPVTLTISTSRRQIAFHHSNHSTTAPAPVEVVVT